MPFKKAQPLAQRPELHRFVLAEQPTPSPKINRPPKGAVQVSGYFNLVGCDLLDGSGVYHHRLFILSPDGGLRMQTNEEAAADAMPPGDDCGRGDELPF
jgi:hypothetical protein